MTATDSPLQRLTVVIPARNEARCLAATVENLYSVLHRCGIDHEILVVDDHSTDGTGTVLNSLKRRVPTLAPLTNCGEAGFGMAVRCGLAAMSGDAVVVMMADASDDSRDVAAHRQW